MAFGKDGFHFNSNILLAILILYVLMSVVAQPIHKSLSLNYNMSIMEPAKYVKILDPLGISVGWCLGTEEHCLMIIIP
ncbi:MAG: hypothetical protein WCF03_08010 [Nitrososphaeraceae archaeon]